MDGAKVYPLPARDPVSGGPLVITELQSPDTGTTIRGRFEMPRFAQLSPDQARYLETFLRCRGMLNSVERELGISYPTARARLDAVLKALDLHAVREDGPSSSMNEARSNEDNFATANEQEEPTQEEVWEATANEDRTFEQPAFEEPSEEPESAFTPPMDEPVEVTAPKRSRMEILTLLERGEITPDEAKRELSQ
ncbi:DUF2089 domain-containing protein [bacterium]|nr:MAG: DUF2089 domain-containing protein [bacterium]